jgi:hypothetical protein
MEEQQPRPDLDPPGGKGVADPRLPRWMWGVSAGWLVLVGGWQPVLALVSMHRENGPSAALALSFAGVGVAATIVFGFILGRWIPRVGSGAKIGCAAPAGCLSWVFWFAISFAVPAPMPDPSADDGPALGVIFFGPCVCLLLSALLGLGIGMGVALRTRTGGGARN